MRGKLVGAAMGAVTAGAVLTACGGGSGGSAAGPTSAAPPSASSSASGAPAASAAQTVQVSATEFTLSLPSTHLTPGTYTFVMKDDGHATHAIALSGPGVANKASATAGPGGSASLTVTLTNGSYVLYCPVGNHRALGMQTDLTVG